MGITSARIIMYTSFVLVNIAFVAAWVTTTKRRKIRGRPSASDVAIGCGTSFLDTLGIGSYAQVTALFKLRGHPADELIPGTLNVGSSVPAFLTLPLFAVAFKVDPVLLTWTVMSAGAGAWIGSGFVSRMKRQSIQLVMGVALLVAACFFVTTNVGILPPTGTAMSLEGWRFAVAVGANFVLGALMCIGIGNYAPTMALLAGLGMHPIAAYPIMFWSDGMQIPLAGLGFVKSGRFAQGAAVGLTIGSTIGTLLALPLVKMLADHLTVLRWMVIGVITYAAVAMLRSAAGSPVAATDS
jgi:hypothetical protein